MQAATVHRNACVGDEGETAGERILSGGPMSANYGIGLVGQLKVLLLDTEPAEFATDTVTVGRLPRVQRPV